jgi:alpha-L-rhamnosidase
MVALVGAATAHAQIPSASSEGFAIVHLETNAAPAPLGLDDPQPRLSWALESEARSVMQQSFRVLVASRPALLNEAQADVWDSGEVHSGDPWIVYAGPALASRTRYYWSVRVQTTEGLQRSAQPAWFETALLDPALWQGEWIAGPERSMERLTPEEGEADDARIQASGEFCRPPRWPAEGFFPNVVPNNQGACRAVRPVPMLRTSFAVTKPIIRARVYATGLGYNDLTINGARVSDHVLDPGFTDYNETVYYTTHDVTDLLSQGENVIAAELGSGQYDSATRTWDWGWDLAGWRATPRLRLQLYLTYADSTEDVVVSDGSWKVSVDGPTRYDSYYLGETYDARREIAGWNAPGFDASGWPAARVVEAPAGAIHAQAHEPIRVVDVLAPGTRTEPTPGVFVYDVGQNLTGWARIRVDAPAGTPVELFYSEKLDSLGQASNDTGFALVGGQLQTDYYIARGSGNEQWTPRFSYKGFRYVQVSSPNGQPLPEEVTVEIEAIEQVRTGFAATSTFAAGGGLLDRIHRNTRWAVESNAHGIITDTPIYEKNAWTGDAQLTVGTAALLFDTERLNAKLFRDMIDAQTDEGEVPHLAPSNEHYGYVGKPAFKPVDCCGATPAWDAFWFVVPWETYRRYGDVRSLKQTYPAMQRYLDGWIPQWTDKDGDAYAYTLTAGLGDWDPPEGTPTNIALSSTAYYAHFAQIAAEVARVLDRPADAERYDTLFERIRTDFNARFLHADGVYRDSTSSPFTQTAQVLPLAFGLAPDHLREDLAARLADDITGVRDGNAYVGILGARYLLPVLTEAGYADVALTVATQTDYPSWGYWIDELGWTGLGEFWEATSRSRNHHFFGTIVQWMYEDLAGMQPLEPGYRKIAFRPTLPAGLDHVSASYESVRGTVATAWQRTTTGLELEVRVPPNATGWVYVPAPGPEVVMVVAGDSAVVADQAVSVKRVAVEDQRIVYEVGSGHYRFRIEKEE